MTSLNITLPDSCYSNPARGPGPVHVLLPPAEGPMWNRTACGVDVGGVLWKVYPGSTNCEACKVAVVEQVLS